jgi:hypothetical protein
MCLLRGAAGPHSLHHPRQTGQTWACLRSRRRIRGRLANSRYPLTSFPLLSSCAIMYVSWAWHERALTLDLQLYRVFPISHNFYICRLLFSPNISQGGRILIGREVRTQDDYDKSIEPYNKRRWPHALLKFSVYDETSYKPSDIPQASPAGTPRFWSYTRGGHSCPVSMLSAPCISPSNAALPKPPIVNIAESDKVLDGVQKACCSPQSAREDVRRLIADFKHDLDNILVTNFTSKQIVSQSPLLPFSSPALPPIGHNGDRTSLQVNLPLCSVCASGKQRSWIVCDYCHVVEVCRCIRTRSDYKNRFLFYFSAWIALERPLHSALELWEPISGGKVRYRHLWLPGLHHNHPARNHGTRILQLQCLVQRPQIHRHLAA